MISLEDLARTVGEKANQNGYTANSAWAGDAMNVQFTRHNGQPGPLLVLSRNNLKQTIGLLDGKRFGPWPDQTESFAWGRFWRAVRLAGGAAKPKPMESSSGYRGR